MLASETTHLQVLDCSRSTRRIALQRFASTKLGLSTALGGRHPERSGVSGRCFFV